MPNGIRSPHLGGVRVGSGDPCSDRLEPNGVGKEDPSVR